MSTKRTTIQPAATAALLLLSIGLFCGLWASGAAIGMISANGSLQVDHARIAGNGTLFDGSVIQTDRASSRIQLRNGVEVRLSSDSRATVFEHRLLLEGGQSEVSAPAGFEVEARTLRISGASAGAQARVRLDPRHRVLVAAVKGSLRVANSAGMVVARIEAGDALDLEPQTAGAAAPTQASGCLVEKAGHLLLVDRTTNVILELEGRELAGNIGNQVQVSGRSGAAKPSPDASQTIAVAGIKTIARGGCTAVAKKLGASTAAAASGAAGAAGAANGSGAAGAGGAAAGAATASGIGVGTVAVIGGVAAAATVGGLAAVGELPGQSSTPVSTSR